MSNIPNKYIAVSYRLYVDGENGKEMIEEATTDKPFNFITGFGFALDAFEKNLQDTQKGNDFSFTLSKEEAYGDYDKAHVIDVDREIFTVNGKFDNKNIYPEAIVPLQNEEGQRFYGKIVEIEEQKVKIDLNHPLAGEALHFEGKVLENRDATNEEVQKLIAHMSGGCSGGCGGNCGDCGEGCGDKGGCGGCGGGCH